MEKRIVVLGSEGFIGKKFIEFQKALDFPHKNLFMVDIREIKKQNYFQCNASNYENLNKIIQKIVPDEIYNFSGSFSNVFEIDYMNNVMVSKNIFDSLIQNKQTDCKVLINGSAAEYGFIKEYSSPVKEDSSLNPVSFYGLSKVYQTFLAKTYFLRDNVNVFVTRPFNIIGYGISNKLFIGRLISEIEQNITSRKKITLGNLDSERDYIDIDDLLKAYKLIMERGAPGEVYNIGSGKSIKMLDLLRIFLEVFNIDFKDVELSKDFVRRFDVPKIVGNISKLKELNWHPTISLKESVSKIKTQFQ
jgi:GDP-4-dehydro-6-deoxy-D-mannose reductase